MGREIDDVVAPTSEGAEQPEDRYLSRGEAARRLGVPPRTIQEWAREGKLPCIYTLGGHRRFSVRDIDALGETLKRRRARRRAVHPTAP